MTDMRPSDQILVEALTELGFTDLAKRAAGGEWNDYFGTHAMPQHHLVATLRSRFDDFPSKIADIEAVVGRVVQGDFDATKTEADEWAASPEGQATFAELLRKNPYPTDEDLRRMVFMDPGDSYVMRMPDGSEECTGYTAEGPRDEAEYAKRLRSIYDRWKVS